MASTTTYLNQATLTDSATQLTLAAYTNPNSSTIDPPPILKIDDEIVLIVSSVNSPTLKVVRGYMGTKAAEHKQYAAAVYGTPADMQASKGITSVFGSLTTPELIQNSQDVTATGATGTDAARITIAPLGVITATGASGAGIHLNYPIPGDHYTIKNMMTGALKIYSVGATINGIAGATGATVTATGNLTCWAFCTVAGAWQIVGNT